MSPNSKYILINGTLEQNGEKSKFSLSFNEYYNDYIQYTYIEVKNKENNTIATCDGSFLGAISPEYRYDITLDLYEENLSCYLNSQKEKTLDDFFNNTK